MPVVPNANASLAVSLVRRRSWLAVILLIAASLLPCAALRAQPTSPKLMPVSEVRPHMKGYAVTVFSGTERDRFEIEIIDVVPDFLTGMDVILFRALDPRLKHSGIVAGMSGSPVYINERLVGAVAYGYAFNKDPVGGITPIASMLEIDALPYRPDVQIRSKRWKAPQSQSWSTKWLDPRQDPLMSRKPASSGRGTQALTPLGQTLGLSGFSPQSREFLGQNLALAPIQGGSGPKNRPKKGPKRQKTFAPGDSVSVLLIAGDNAAASNGTVTWVGGKNNERVLAYGHPMRGSGATELPIADAHVHTIISSVQRSFKLSSPIQEQGVMVQDRQPAIAIKTNLRAPMIPVTTEIQGPEARLKPRRYQNRVAVHPDLTPSLVTSILLNAVGEAAGDATEVIVHTDHEIEYSTKDGRNTARIEERTFFPAGADGRVLGRSRALSALSAILYNPFDLGEIHRVVQKIRVEYGAPVERIESIQLLSSEVRAGETLSLLVKLRGIRDQKYRMVPLRLRIPKHCANQSISVHVAGGDWVRPYRAIANSVDSVVRSLSAAFPERSMVATIYTEQEGLSTRHGMLEQLPPSIMGTLNAPASTQEKLRFKHAARRVLPQPTFIAGAHEFRLDVKGPRLDITPNSYFSRH